MREKLMKFMYGRYGGADALGKFLMGVYLVLFLIGAFLRVGVIMLAALLIAGYSMFRTLSRNIYQRQKENAFYLKWKKRFLRPFTEMRDKTHAYRTCPHCKARLRLPKKKGRHTVCCPRCNKDFDVRI